MIKIIKIITAINNPNLNNKLNMENNIEVVCKDLQYKDAILDILNENKNVDIIIINNEIPSEINDDELIKKIKEFNDKIRIIYFLEKLNKNIEEILNKNNIKEIYFNNEITINKIIEIIHEKNNYKINNELNSNDEIKKELLELKKIVYEKNDLDNKKIFNNNFLINFNLIKNFKNKIKSNININENKNLIKNNFYKNKIITVSGPPNVGKTNFIINFYKIIKNKKILIIDFDFYKKDLKLFLGIKKYYKIKKHYDINFDNKYFKNNLEKNIDLISIKELLKINFNNINFDLSEFKNFIQEFFEKEKNNYDLILIDLGSENNPQINNLIFEKSDINILLTEGNLIGVKKFKLYLNKFNKINNLKIIINKKDIFSIDDIFLQKLFGFEIVGNIKYKKLYSNLINNHFNFYCNFKNNYKKEYEKIFNKLNI